MKFVMHKLQVHGCFAVFSYWRSYCSTDHLIEKKFSRIINHSLCDNIYKSLFRIFLVLSWWWTYCFKLQQDYFTILCDWAWRKNCVISNISTISVHLLFPQSGYFVTFGQVCGVGVPIIWNIISWACTVRKFWTLTQV